MPVSPATVLGSFMRSMHFGYVSSHLVSSHFLSLPLRLCSVDHVDLFISNERPEPICRMLRGLPHALLVSNRQGEKQVLLPVIKPIRPIILSEPFSTHLVLSREPYWMATLSQKFYLYPVHVSLSFLIPQGINPSMYLLLLRFLHRDYASAYRLTDAIASDSALPAEAGMMFELLPRLKSGDGHPDACALRSKLVLLSFSRFVDFFLSLRFGLP